MTIDAIGTQTKITKTIIEQGGDFLLAVKEKQGNLYEDIQALFEEDQRYHFEDVPYDYAKTVNKGHGRIEIRQCWAISDPEYLAQIRERERWHGLKSVVTITREDSGVQLYKNAFVTDFEVRETTVEAIARDGRARWKIENENNNVLKTKGYHIEHNFGHGDQHLASLLLSLNLLAFLFHTVLDLVDEQTAPFARHWALVADFFKIWMLCWSISNSKVGRLCFLSCSQVSNWIPDDIRGFRWLDQFGCGDWLLTAFFCFFKY